MMPFYVFPFFTQNFSFLCSVLFHPYWLIRGSDPSSIRHHASSSRPAPRRQSRWPATSPTHSGLGTPLPRCLAPASEHHSLTAHLYAGPNTSLPPPRSRLVSGILVAISMNLRDSRSLCMRGATFSAPPPCDGSS